MSDAGRATAGATGSPWTRPPEQPSDYRLPARLSDMLHGWLDGKKGLPRLPGADERDGEDDADSSAGPGLSIGSVPAVPLTLETARMHVLSREALALIRNEEIRFRDECAVLRPQHARFLAERDTVTSQLIAAAEKLEQARREPAHDDLSKRRLAERDAGERPEDLVRARRRAEWQRRLALAEREFNVVTERHATAVREAALRTDLIRERAGVARAAAQRHHELALRRIATYLQQLIRTHGQGADLNQLLIGKPVGPELPKWVSAGDDSFLQEEAESE